MEAVKQFNQELSALYEIKPPISKAKMTSITKGAIRSIKYYKHVVQSVEKFIQKCRSEYKIPGLYVIDSIVRQSRHQFGPDKDVFAPRFAKNAQLTFYHLYKCSEEEKSRVIRVLNLWQKNEVFTSEVIQPLFDLANANSELSKQMEEQISKTGGLQKIAGNATKQGPGTIQVASMASITGIAQTNQLLTGETQNMVDQTQIAQQIQQLLNSQGQQDTAKFSSKLLDDFDYSDEESSPRVPACGVIAGAGGSDRVDLPAQTLDALTMIISTERGIQELKQSGHVSDSQIQQLQRLLSARQNATFIGHQVSPQSNSYGTVPAVSTGPDHADPHMQFIAQGHSIPHSVDMSQPPPMGGTHMPPWGPIPNNQMVGQVAQQAPLIDISMDLGREDNLSDIVEVVDDREGGWNSDRGNNRLDKAGSKRKDKDVRRNRRASRSRSRSRSRDKDRGGKRIRRERRSRSRSPYGDRHRRGKGRSTSRDRRDKREDEKRDDERRREREKKGLPPMRKGFLSVCSTTLWVGHLSKLIAEDDLSDMFGEYGEILSINTIPPRGCAFICMNRRMDAYKALKQLHKTKLHGKQMTLAWAPGKGMKDKQWKDYWDVDLGVSYIPIDRLDPQTDMATLEAGGMFDEDTMPEWMRTMRGVAPSTTTNNLSIPLMLQPDQVQQISPQQQVGLQPSTTANATTAPPPGYVNLPSVTAAGLPVPQPIPCLPGAPPGIPPFGLPPGIPPNTGLLPPPAGPSGLLTGAPGLLPAPGTTSLPGLSPAGPPANLLLGQPGCPRFAGITGPLSVPPPGFPGLDVSQPPPGVARKPFGVPPQLGASSGQFSSGNSSGDRDRHSSGHSVHMEIEDGAQTGPPPLHQGGRDGVDRHGRERRDWGHRESRWGGREATGRDERLDREYRDSRDYRREQGDRHGEGERDYRSGRRDNRVERDDHGGHQGGFRGILGREGGRDGTGGSDDSAPLISRLRDLAGHNNPGPSQDRNEGPRSLLSMSDVPNLEEWKATKGPSNRDSEDQSFHENIGGRPPPPFTNTRGLPEDAVAIPTFSGPPPGMGAMFEDGPQKPHVGLPGINFDGGPFGPPPFANNIGNGHPPFGDFGQGHGGAPRGGWRGRGGPPFSARGGNRGVFREGTPGGWMNDVGPPGRVGGRGGRGRGGFRDGPPDFNGPRSRDNLDGPSRGFPRGDQRGGRGGRGGFGNFGPPGTEVDEFPGPQDKSSERREPVRGFDPYNRRDIDSSAHLEKSTDSPLKDTGSKRERKSRWGESESIVTDVLETNSEAMEKATVLAETFSTAPENDFQLSETSKNEIEYHEQQPPKDLSINNTNVVFEETVSGSCELNGGGNVAEVGIAVQNDGPDNLPNINSSNTIELDNQALEHQDTQTTPANASVEFDTEPSLATAVTDDPGLHQRHNVLLPSDHATLDHVPFEQAVILPKVVSGAVGELENSAATQQQNIPFEGEPNDENGSNPEKTVELTGNEVLEETAA